MRAGGQGWLGLLPLRDQGLLDVFGAGKGSDGEEQRGGALGPGGVGHLDGGSLADLLADHLRIQWGVGEQVADLAGAWAGQVQAAVPGGAGRGARGYPLPLT